MVHRLSAAHLVLGDPAELLAVSVGFGVVSVFVACVCAHWVVCLSFGQGLLSVYLLGLLRGLERSLLELLFFERRVLLQSLGCPVVRGQIMSWFGGLGQTCCVRLLHKWLAVQAELMGVGGECVESHHHIFITFYVAHLDGWGYGQIFPLPLVVS